jgi:hypothetical protein
MIFSSSNKDLSEYFPFLVDLCSYFKTNIWTYEVSSSLKENKEIHMTIYEFIFSQCIKYEKIPSNFILIGYLKGCLKSLLITIKCSTIKALIMISPCNFIRVKLSENVFNSNCPIFLIHGKKNKISDYKMTLNLASKLRNTFEWYPKNADHSNILTDYRCKLLMKIKMFLKKLETELLNNLPICTTYHSENITDFGFIIKSNNLYSKSWKYSNIKFDDDIISKKANKGFENKNKVILNYLDSDSEYLKIKEFPFEKDKNAK